MPVHHSVVTDALVRPCLRSWCTESLNVLKLINSSQAIHKQRRNDQKTIRNRSDWCTAIQNLSIQNYPSDLAEALEVESDNGEKHPCHLNSNASVRRPFTYGFCLFWTLCIQMALWCRSMYRMRRLYSLPISSYLFLSSPIDRDLFGSLHRDHSGSLAQISLVSQQCCSASNRIKKRTLRSEQTQSAIVTIRTRSFKNGNSGRKCSTTALRNIRTLIVSLRRVSEQAGEFQ